MECKQDENNIYKHRVLGCKTKRGKPRNQNVHALEILST